MPIIQIDEKEIAFKSSSPQTVDQNGRISVGRSLAGKKLIVYAVEV